MINPSVKYKVQVSGGDTKRIYGVVISLKEFLSSLDKHSISHDTEKVIRQILRKSPMAVTHTKQYFSKGSSSSIIRSSSTCKACVCIPKEDVPDDFFDWLAHPGMAISNHAYILHRCRKF